MTRQEYILVTIFQADLEAGISSSAAEALSSPLAQGGAENCENGEWGQSGEREPDGGFKVPT